FVATPENLGREGSRGPRKDFSGYLRTAYEAARLSPAHEAAWTWLVAQPGGPARGLAISEGWASGRRRGIPLLSELADPGGPDLRIFTRDGKVKGRGPGPEADSPNADLMAQFLNERNGQTFQSIPVIVFYTKDFTPLYRYTEFPAVYRKDRIRAVTDDAAFMEMLASPFFEVWRSAALAEWTSLLYERLRVGSLA